MVTLFTYDAKKGDFASSFQTRRKASLSWFRALTIYKQFWTTARALVWDNETLMNIPHKVQIKPGVFYMVAYVDKFDDPKQRGRCASKHEKFGSRTIFIQKGLGPRLEQETFVHELLHAIEFEYNVTIPHRLIYALEYPLRRLFSLNPTMLIPSIVEAAAAKKRRRPRAKKKTKKKTR
jgi:hypothetical protein